MKVYEFIYKITDGSWGYYDFIRRTDTDISIQKQEIAELVENDLHVNLLDALKGELLKRKGVYTVVVEIIVDDRNVVVGDIRDLQRLELVT